jgi:predicted nucleic acid-binding protein
VIVVDSSVWIDFFHGVSTPEVERLDGLLGVTPLAIGDLVLVEVMQGFRTDQDVATARQLFRSLALLPMLGGSNAWKAAENYRRLREDEKRIDVGLVRGGIGEVEEAPHLVSLGVVGYEVLWVFCHGRQTLDDLPGLRGKTVAIGGKGAGMRRLVRTRLAAIPHVLAEPGPVIAPVDVQPDGVLMSLRVAALPDHHAQVVDEVNRVVVEQFGPVA